MREAGSLSGKKDTIKAMSNSPNAPADSMEDILSSIKTSVAEETAKVGMPRDEGAEEVLALSPDDILDGPALTPQVNGSNGSHALDAPIGEGLIDINAFASGGDQKPVSMNQAVEAVGADGLGADASLPEAPTPAPQIAPAAPVVPAVPAAAPVAPPAALPPEAKAADDEFDRLLAELGQEEGGAAATAAAPSPMQALAAEVASGVGEAPEEDLSALVAAAKPMVAPVAAPAVAEAPVGMTAPAAPMIDVPAVAPVAPLPVVASTGGRLELPAIQGVGGLQVAFPAEVLAAALRPMVQGWVSENLPGIVERLVKEEIAKLAKE